jgi:putative tryptophan/tyrosine transport system substrate-binding protein
MASYLGRRKFLATLGGAAVAWPLAARAQQAGKLPTIGFLGANPSIESSRLAAFVQRLRELGWIDGRNLAIEYRWAEGRNERYAENAAELVRLKVDVIATSATPPTVAAKQATAVIPIVFAAVTDPVGTGLVATLSRPGGNVTGLANQISDTAGKKLEFLREILPGLRRLAIMANVGNPGSVMDMREAQAAARTLGLMVTTSEIRRAEDIAPAFETLKDRADAIYLCPDPLMNTNRTRINILAVGARLPTMHAVREYVEAGGLISYGPNLPDHFRRAAEFVDKILRGAKPADLPVEQPTKFDLIINLTTAKALGLEVPRHCSPAPTRYATARVHHAARQRGGVAARGAGAATDGKAADHRFLGSATLLVESGAIEAIGDLRELLVEEDLLLPDDETR